MFSILRSPLIAVCLVAIGIFLIYAGHKNAAEFAALRDHGKTAEAEITKLEWKEKKSTHDDNRYTAYVRFITEDGREIREDIHITAELGRALRNQAAPSVMTVRYLPESPTTLRDAGKMDPSDAQGAVGGYMLLAGIVMLALRFFFKRDGE